MSTVEWVLAGFAALLLGMLKAALLHRYFEEADHD